MPAGKPKSSADQAKTRGTRKKFFGKNLLRLGMVSSTQDELKKLFLQGAPDGTIVVAQEQERGRGRREKSWHSMSGRGLWMSVLLQPEGRPEIWTWTPLWAGLVVHHAITDLLKSHSENISSNILLKWPNDILLEGRKLCGILSEQVQDCQGRQAVILGIGINLSQRQEDFLPHLRGVATSLLDFTGESFEPDAMLEKMILSLEDFYPLLKPIAADRIRRAFLSHAWGVGERLRLMVAGRREEGIFEGLGPAGEIRLRDSDGKISSFVGADKIERA
ncbi:MAG TPA: biotin--[acetyl-CoA-carboxylase] ligase [bacterium]|jgi:BirA family biotin operon repressor/biotin-[acetyl-CoA-carboxylase] ligase